MTVTALTLVITIQRGVNLTYNNAYSNYAPSINFTVSTTTTQMIFRFILQSGQLPPGGYICAGQFLIPNVNRTTSADTYSITTTNICGVVNSVSGTF